MNTDMKLVKVYIQNMNAIRRDEELDATHSIYVDQWDWEKSFKRMAYC